VVSWQGLVLTATGGDHRPNDTRVHRLTLDGTGAVCQETLWEKTGKGWLSSSGTPVLIDGVACSGPQVIDLTTGAVLASGLRMGIRRPRHAGRLEHHLPRRGMQDDAIDGALPTAAHHVEQFVVRTLAVSDGRRGAGDERDQVAQADRRRHRRGLHHPFSIPLSRGKQRTP
jgi:hypothetical protein